MGLAAVMLDYQPLSVLLAGLAVDAIPDVDVVHVAIDSRAVVADTLFLAYAGTQTHGLDHADEAIANGAVAVAWDRDAAPQLGVPAIRVPALAANASLIAARLFEYPGARLFATGITGTDGKTSCAWLLAQALDKLGQRCGYLGTLGFGLRDNLVEATLTTPDPVAVQSELARLIAAGAEAVAVEVSSHALAQHRVDAVAFDVAVLTQIGRDHLDYHGDVEHYARAKQRLFALDGLKHAVLNGDDPYGRAWLAALDRRVTPIVYGHGDVATLADAYVRLASVRASAGGLSLDIESSWGDARIDSTLVGVFNAENLVAVLCVLLVRGIALDSAAATLGTVFPVPGRMERIDTRSDQPLVVVDYAHTPNALTQALRAVQAHARGAVFCVFGCGGDRDRGKRPLMGAAAVAVADRVWLTDDNPRTETPARIVADIRAGIDDEGGRVCVLHDRAAAIAAAIAAAAAGDAVLIAGKGHETTQQIGSERLAFDDRLVAHRLLEVA